MVFHLFFWIVLMELPVAIRDAVTTLGRRNKREACAESLITLLKGCYLQCEDDYKRTSTKQRFSTGKLEKKIFLLLADICQWENGNENAKQAGEIMTMLGYASYKLKPNRFRQKVENEKKKRNGKCQHRRRSAQARRVRNDDYLSDESYSDNETYYEPETNSGSGFENCNSLAVSPLIGGECDFPVVGFADDNSPTEVFADPIFASVPMYEPPRNLTSEELEVEYLKQFQSYDNKDAVFPILPIDDYGYDDDLIDGLSQPLNDNSQEDQYPTWFFDL